MPAPVLQFKRSFRLDAGSTRIESTEGALALKIAFEVRRKTKPEPGSASVKIWNLNEESRAAIESLDAVPVKLDVGYGKHPHQIFFGTLTKATSEHTGADWVTTVQGGDGTDKLAAAQIHRSFAKGAPLATVLTALVDALGVPHGNLALASKVLGLGALSHGQTFSGPAAEEITAFTRSHGLVWSIQSGAFTVQEFDQPIPGTQGPRVAPDTGLIGSPSVIVKGKKAGEVTFKALILPELIPGVPFQLESSRVNGDFVAVETRHYGDSTAQDWYVECKGKLLSGKKAK